MLRRTIRSDDGVALERAGLLGKGHEYFLKHLLGATDSAVRAEESPPELRPRDVVWREPAPRASST